jgi:hypothetical protein
MPNVFVWGRTCCTAQRPTSDPGKCLVGWRPLTDIAMPAKDGYAVMSAPLVGIV